MFVVTLNIWKINFDSFAKVAEKKQIEIICIFLYKFANIERWNVCVEWETGLPASKLQIECELELRLWSYRTYVIHGATQISLSYISKTMLDVHCENISNSMYFRLNRSIAWKTNIYVHCAWWTNIESKSIGLYFHSVDILENEFSDILQMKFKQNNIRFISIP